MSDRDWHRPWRGHRPLAVAANRGLLWSLAAAILGVVIAATPADLETLGPWAPLIVLVARVLEAVVLDRRQPPQIGALGGQGPA